jgi:hypothetical protein
VFRWGGSICFSSKLTAILNHRSFAIAKELSPLTNVVGWMSIEDVWNVVRSLKDNNLGARLAVLLMEPPTGFFLLFLYYRLLEKVFYIQIFTS